MNVPPNEPLPISERDPLLTRIDELLRRLESINGTHAAIRSGLGISENQTESIGGETEGSQSSASTDHGFAMTDAAVLHGTVIARIDELARALGSEEIRAAELLARVNDAWERLSRLTPPADANPSTGIDDGVGVQPILVASPPADVRVVRGHDLDSQSHSSLPAFRHSPSRTVGIVAFSILVLVTAATLALTSLADDDPGLTPGSLAGVSSPTSTSSPPSPTSDDHGIAARAQATATDDTAMTATTSAVETPRSTTTTAPSPTQTAPATSPATPRSATPTPSSTVTPTSGVTALTQGIGASREEIEQALGDREYVRDGRSYYLDGRAWAEFDGGVASLIAVDFADPPPLDSVNALLERLRPKDARLIDAGADASTTLLRVFESANIRDVFGEDRRYLERVRIDATSGEILGIEIAAEPAESHPR